MKTAFAFTFAILSSVLLGSGMAWATDCSPYCDYVHDYGPYDFSWVRPGLTGYPVCDSQGNCAPHLIYVHPGRRHGQINIRPVPYNERLRR